MRLACQRSWRCKSSMEHLEATMSRRQLHEAERGVGEGRSGPDPATIREAAFEARARDARSATPAVALTPLGQGLVRSVRTCGVEAVDGSQRRTRVKLRKADEVRVSVPQSATPDTQTGPRGSGDGEGETLRGLTQRDLRASAPSSRRGRGNDDPSTCLEKSDHLVVATKPGNSGGAKGVTG